jgi:hypothetical protein
MTFTRFWKPCRIINGNKNKYFNDLTPVINIKQQQNTANELLMKGSIFELLKHYPYSTTFIIKKIHFDSIKKAAKTLKKYLDSKKKYCLII